MAEKRRRADRRYAVDTVLGTSTDGTPITELTDPASPGYIASLSKNETGAIDAKT
jgi:hypothetical protein